MDRVATADPVEGVAPRDLGRPQRFPALGDRGQGLTGELVVDRLEDGVRDARRGDVGGTSAAKAPKPAPRPVRQAPARPDLRAEPADKTGAPFGAARIKHPALSADDTVRSFPNLKAIEDGPDVGSSGREPMEMEPRSEAERELLKALRAARQA